MKKQAIKNNPDKFPAGYILEADKDQLIKNFDRFKKIKNHPWKPKAFTTEEKESEMDDTHLQSQSGNKFLYRTCS